jgi:hypothetical protein
VGVVADEDVAADAVADAGQEQHLRRPQASVSCAGKWVANRQHAPKGTRPRKKEHADRSKCSFTDKGCQEVTSRSRTGGIHNPSGGSESRKRSGRVEGPKRIK